MFKDHKALGVADDLTNSTSGMTLAFERQRQEALKRELMTDRLSKTLTLILMLAGLLFGVAISLVISHSILHTIHRMSEMIETVSSNNLTVEYISRSSQEISATAS